MRDWQRPVAPPARLEYITRMAQNRFPPASGPSQRQLRVGELIRRTLSEVLARGDVHDPELNRFSITVGEVRVSPDLHIATVYVMPLGGGQREEAIALADDSLIVPLNTEIALLAADLTLSHKLAFADAVIYASARKYQTELVTSDDHFKGLPGVTYISKKEA